MSFTLLDWPAIGGYLAIALIMRPVLRQKRHTD
jgi:hypothetical protein